MKKNYFNFLKLLCFFPIAAVAQVSLPYTEEFGDSPSQTQWDYSSPAASPITVSNTGVSSPSSGPGGSLMYNFFNGQGQSIYNVKSPLLNNTNNSPISVTFDFAAANRYTMPVPIQTIFADDHILLEYSTDGGQTFTQFHDYEIGKTGELNTGGTISGFFTPTASQWVTKSITLPAGTNKVNFKGIKNIVNQAGNFAYLDHVIFQSCNTPAPTGNSTQSFCNGQTLGDLMSTITGSNIQWYAAATGGGALSNTTPIVNGTTYYASQTVNGCESTTRTAITVQVGGCLSTDEVSFVNDFSFYPNPVEDVLFINSKINVVKAEIYSADGRLVQVAQDKQIVSIGTSRLIKGIYFVEFTFQNGKKLQHKIIRK